MVKRVIADIVYSGPVRGYALKSCRLECGGWPPLSLFACLLLRPMRKLRCSPDESQGEFRCQRP